MPRYTVRLTHVPGHGAQDHLFDEFVYAVQDRLQVHGYARKHGARAALIRAVSPARAASDFDGDFAFAVVETATTGND
jgi:hypothetical protein